MRQDTGSSSERADLRLDWFPSEGAEVTLMLTPKDLALASEALSTFDPDERRVVEIGVYRGWWAVGVLMNVASASIVGIDPYPGEMATTIRPALEANLAGAGAGGRFELFATRMDATGSVPPGSVAMVHVDGEHTEQAVSEDLRWAAEVLRDDGMVVLDDYRNAWWPGIGSAMHGFLREAGFRIVLVTERKAYICRTAAHARWLRHFEDRLTSQSDVSWSRHWREGLTPGHPQRPDVLDHRVLLLLGPADVRPHRRAPVAPLTRGRFHAATAAVLEESLPPVLLRALVRAVRYLRTTAAGGRR